MADQFNVAGAITPANPITGQAIKVTISGDDVHTEASAGSIDIIVHVAAMPGGAMQDIAVSMPCTVIATTHESVKITGVSDASGRPWTVAADGLTASAVT